MTSVATHPMTTGGRREYLAGRALETAALLFIGVASVVFSTVGMTPGETGNFILNAAGIAELAGVAAIIAATILQRRAWHWVVGGSSKNRAPEPRWLSWGIFAIHSLLIVAFCWALIAWVQYPALLAFDALLFFVMAGVCAAGFALRGGRSRAKLGILLLLAAAAASVLAVQGGGVGTVNGVAAIIAGVALGLGLYAFRRGSRTYEWTRRIAR